MNDDSNLIPIAAQSFYSPEVYRHVRNWRGSALRYLAIVLCVFWIPGLFQIHGLLRTEIRHFQTDILPQLPVIYFDNGKIKTPENRPYLVRLTVKPIYAMIDTSGQHTSLPDINTLLLLTGDKAIVRAPGMDTLTFDLSKCWFKPKVIDRSFLIRLCQSLKSWMFGLFCIAILLLSFLIRLIQSVCLASIAWSATSALRFDFKFRELINLAIVAMTPAMFFESVLGMFDAHTSFFGLLGCFLIIGYFVFAIVSTKSTIANETTSWWGKSERMVFVLPGVLTLGLVPVPLTLFLIGFPRWGTLNFQTQYSTGIHVMDIVFRWTSKLMFPWIGLIWPILLGICCLLLFVHYVVHAVNWRSRKSILWFFLSQTSLGTIGYFLAKSLEWPLIHFYSALHSWYGEEYWGSFVLPPLLALACFFLVVTTWVCWGYIAGATETNPENRRHRFQRGCVFAGALLLLYGGLRIAFLIYGDNGKSFGETIGLNEKDLPIRTVVLVGDSPKESDRFTPLQIELTAEWLTGIPRPGQTQTFNASLENLRRIESWLANHPRSMYTGVAYSALATGYLAQWDVDTAYLWLHRYPQIMLVRMLDIGVLNVGPLKPERKMALDEWADKSKWVLGPISQAKLSGQFQRYGDIQTAERLSRAVLASSDAAAKSKLAQFAPSQKAIANGVIRGVWATQTVRPIRVGLFRMSTTDGQPIKGAPFVPWLSLTKVAQFMNLIDSQNLEDDRRWEFKYLREGGYVVGFLFDAEKFKAGKCVRLANAPHRLNLSKQHPLLDLGQVQMRPCEDIELSKR